MSYIVEFEDIGLSDYKKTWDYQAEIFKKLIENKISGKDNSDSENPLIPGVLIFVEHPHVYTLGKSGSEDNLLIDNIQLNAKNAVFYRTDRGGDITYHGPGQIVGYPVFDLGILRIGLKEYISRLEEAVIRTIREYGLEGKRMEGRTGVWLNSGIEGKERKICAIGVKASRFITMHGFAFNVNTDLNYFNYINPCGFTDKGVTSLENETGTEQDIEHVKSILKENIRDLFDLIWQKHI
ncbi:MAG: lipoyl(octanoyl) transferase LipB [Bacteroidetes bacterium]|nr:lipoyl(octanoyl) transferase LipB [Bacteroidota bacterium]